MASFGDDARKLGWGTEEGFETGEGRSAMSGVSVRRVLPMPTGVLGRNAEPVSEVSHPRDKTGHSYPTVTSILD